MPLHQFIVTSNDQVGTKENLICSKKDEIIKIKKKNKKKIIQLRSTKFFCNITCLF